MFPKLYNRSGELQAVLDNIIGETAAIKRVVNGEFTFTFEAYEKELKSEYFDVTNNIVINDQTFDIKYIEQTHDGEVKYSIQCEHVNYRMADGEENLFTSFACTGTPTQVLTQILSGTEFSVGTVAFTDAITISATSEINRKNLIYQLANILGGEVEYTNKGFTINILATIGQNRGFQARFGKNLKGVTKTIDGRGGLKTYYSVDLVELKNCTEYVEKHMQDLEVVGEGDTIRIIDSVIGLDVENRVLSIEKNPIFEINTKLEIANTIELITDTINKIDTNSVRLDKVYNDVSISKDYGFKASRSDQLARGILGGGTISLDTGDGEGNYTPAIYFDASARKYKVIGDIIMEGGSISWSLVNAPSATQVGARPYDWLPTPQEIGARPTSWMPSASDVGAISSTYIDQYGVFTPEVYATRINTLYGKITTAQIENLIVGGNVQMGPYATISWGQVTSQPTIPTLPSYLGTTYISATTIYSPTISGATITGSTVQNDGSYTKTILDANGVTFKDSNSRNKMRLYVEYDNNANLAFYDNNGGSATFWMADDKFGLQNNGKLFSISGNASVGGTLTAYNIMGNTFNAPGDVQINSGTGGKIYLNAFNARDVWIGGSGSSVGFMGAYPMPKQTAQRLSLMASLEDVIYKLNGLLDKLGLYGLFTVYD